MKKIVKLLALIICMFVLSSLSVSADTKVDEVRNRLSGLGLIDAEYGAENDLTRGEFADLIAAFFKEDVRDYSKDNLFKDITEDNEFADSINKIANYQMMSGDGNGIFDAESKITHDHMKIVLVRLLGYTWIAEYEGYISIANDLGLSKGVKSTYTTGEAALIMLDNALDTKVTEQIISTKPAITVSDEDTLLNKALDIYKTTGIVRGVGITAIDEAYERGYGKVLIGDNVFETLTDNPNEFIPFVGKNVTAYYKVTDNDEKVLLWLEIKKVEEKTFLLKDIVDIDGTIVTYVENDRHKTLKLKELPYVVYNNRSKLDIPAFGKVGYITFIDNGNGYDTVIIKDYQTAVVNTVSLEEQIITTTVPNSVFELADFEDVRIVDISGKPLKLEDVQIGNIISVAKDAQGEIIEIAVSDKEVYAIAEDVDYTEKEITLNGKTYSLTPDFSNYLETFSLSSVLNQEEKVFRLDVCGYVAFTEMSATTGVHIGYLVRFFMDEENDKAIARIFTQTGDMREFEMRRRNGTITVDGQRYDPIFFKDDNSTQTGKFKGFIITYTLSADGQVREIKTAKSEPGNGLYLFSSVTGGKYRPSQLSFNNDVMMSQDAVIFQIPKEEEYWYDQAAYSILNFNMFNNNSQYSDMKFYSIEEDDMAAKVVVKSETIAESSLTIRPMLVTKITSGINSDDEPIDVVRGYCSAGEVVLEARPGIDITKTVEGYNGAISETEIKVGDVVLAKSNYYGETTGVQLIYDASEDHCYFSNPHNLWDYQHQFTKGTVSRYKDGIVEIKIDGTTAKEYYKVNDSTNILVVTKEQSDKFVAEKGNIADIRAADIYGKGSGIYVHATYGVPQMVVVYN